MAITNITKPDTWARVYDTNRMVYKFSSTNSSQPNFQYQFNMRAYKPDGTYDDLGNYNLHASTDGTVEFNPAQIYTNYLTIDFDASNTGTEELLQTAKKFQLFVYEFYGTPPTRKLTGNWYETVPTNCYNGCQQNIPYDYLGLNPDGNSKWVLSTGTTKGDFLTDNLTLRLDNTELAFAYGLCDIASRPTRIRYTIYYWGYSQISPADVGVFGNGSLTNYQQPSPNPTAYITLDNGGTPPPVGNWGWLTAVTYDTNVTFNWVNSLGFYAPIGPYQAINYSSALSARANDWAFYDVDALKGSTVLNKTPIRIIRSNSCNKYGTPWQMFWLNPHGGFDTYVFDKKTDLDYKIKRDTYKQKLPPTYSTYSAGEKVYNIDSTAEITLRTKLLSQQEAQLIVQMAQSPVVYSVKKYYYNGAVYPYGVPMIVVSDSIKYENKKNSKEITMEIKVRESNQKIIQRN